MLRKNSIVKFVFLVIIAILGILLCILPFNIPTSTDVYNGFLFSIEKGMDLRGGTVALYDCTLPNGSKVDVDEAIDNSLTKIQSILSTEGYEEFKVVRQGDDKIRLEIVGNQEFDETFTYLEDEKSLFITLEQISDSVTETTTYISSDGIKTARLDYDYDNSVYGVTIEFNDKGLQDLETLKNYANQTSTTTAYVYLEEVNANNLFAEVSISNLNNTTLLTASSSGSYTISSADDARTLAYSIIAGSLDVRMELKDWGNISPSLGEDALSLIYISIFIVFVLGLIFMIVRYGDLGLLGSLSIIFFLILEIFFMQAIPLIVLNLTGVFSVLLTIVLVFISNIYIFEKIKQEYAIGKKIHLACKGGFRKALWPILDSHFLLILTAIFIWIFAPASLKCFGIILILGALLSMFSSLVMTRYFVNIYLPINSTKAKRLHLYRETGVKEIKDDDIALTQVESNIENEIVIDENDMEQQNKDEVNSIKGGDNNE